LTRQAWLLFAAISFLWGLPYLFIKVAVRELDPSVVVRCRVGIAALVLIPLLIKRCFSDIPQLGAIAAALVLATLMVAPLALLHLPAPPPSATTVAAVVALGLLCTALGFLTYFKLIAVAGASRASVITYVNPAIAVALGVLVLAEPLTMATLGGFVLILVGCWLSTGGGLPGRFSLNPAGSSTPKRGGVPYWSGVLPPHRQ
jgi:drug/metabolite transporter (DMT)-like permease